MSTFKVLDLSTAHLPERLAAWDNLCSVPGVLVVMHSEYAYLIHVPDTDDQWSDRDLCPAEVAMVIMYARDRDCDYILLDGDGSTCEDLPTWEWS